MYVYTHPINEWVERKIFRFVNRPEGEAFGNPLLWVMDGTVITSKTTFEWSHKSNSFDRWVINPHRCRWRPTQPWRTSHSSPKRRLPLAVLVWIDRESCRPISWLPCQRAHPAGQQASRHESWVNDAHDIDVCSLTWRARLVKIGASSRTLFWEKAGLSILRCRLWSSPRHNVLLSTTKRYKI